jgi:CAAX protease family protein
VDTLLRFFSLTYLVTWICFIAVAAAIPANTPLGAVLVYVGAIAPSLVALWLTARVKGAAGVRTLLAGVIKWRVAARWYFFAIGYTAAVKLSVAVIHRVAVGRWPCFDETPLWLIPLAIAVSTPVQAGEEIGWRGYALPRLAERFGLARASILLGVIWACWHLPQFYIREADTYRQSFIVFLLQVTAISVAMAWLYTRTNGSLLLTMLLHASVNNSKDIVPSALPGGAGIFGLKASLVAWLTVVVLWICAGYFLAAIGKMQPSCAPGSCTPDGAAAAL